MLMSSPERKRFFYAALTFIVLALEGVSSFARSLFT